MQNRPIISAKEIKSVFSSLLKMFVYLVYKKYIVEFLCSHFIRPAPHPPNRIGMPHSLRSFPCSLFRPSPQPAGQVLPHFPSLAADRKSAVPLRNRTGRATGGSPSGERKTYLMAIMLRIERSARRRTSSSSDISGRSSRSVVKIFSSVIIFIYLQLLHPHASSSGGAGINVFSG